MATGADGALPVISIAPYGSHQLRSSASASSALVPGA